MKYVRATALWLVVAVPLLTVACTGTEGRKQRYLDRGQAYLEEDNLDKARVEISNALQIDPNNAQARYFAGRIAEKQVKAREAVGHYEAAVEADPNFVAARAALGRIYFLGGLPDKARAAIEPGLARAPDDAQLRTVRGALRAMDGDAAGALADGEAAVKADPKDEVAVSFLAAQYARQERADDAIALLRKTLAQSPDSTNLSAILAELLYQGGHKAESLQQLENIAKAQPTDLAHWQRLARVLLLEKNTDGAIDALRRSVAANPKSIEAKQGLAGLIGTYRGGPAAVSEMQKFVDASPKNAELKIALAQLLEQVREPARAEALYREVIKAEGVKTQGLTARGRLAAMLVQKPDLPAAEALIAEVLAENPRDSDALVLRAGIAMSRRNAVAAITDLRAVLRDQPESTPILRALASAHVQNGEAALAEEALRNAVQVNPADTAARFELASLLTSSGRGKQALPVIEQLIKDAPDNVQAREVYFRVQMALADVAGARKTAEELKTLRPDQPVGPMLLGALHESERKIADAIPEYESALKLSNDPGPALMALVRIDLTQKQYARAVGRIEPVIAQAPRYVQVHNLLGEVQIAAANFPAAIQAFDGAIALQPTWWMPYRGKAMAQVLAKQPDAVVNTLREGVEKTGALELDAALATAYEEQGNVDQAIATYEAALKRHPRAVAAANSLAMLLLTHRASDKASVARAAQVATLLEGSESPMLLDTLGWVKYHQGAYPEALALLLQAARKVPNSPDVMYHLGMAHLRNGDQLEARRNLEAAVRSGANFRGVAEAKASLATLARPG